MSYICDVCGPRDDCNSIFCDNCKVGIIYKININKSDMQRQIPDMPIDGDAQTYSVLHQIHSVQARQGVGAST